MRGPELRPALARCGEPARASASQLATAEDGREIAIRPKTTEAGGRARCGGFRSGRRAAGGQDCPAGVGDCRSAGRWRGLCGDPSARTWARARCCSASERTRRRGTTRSAARRVGVAGGRCPRRRRRGSGAGDVLRAAGTGLAPADAGSRHPGHVAADRHRGGDLRPCHGIPAPDQRPRHHPGRPEGRAVRGRAAPARAGRRAIQDRKVAEAPLRAVAGPAWLPAAVLGAGTFSWQAGYPAALRRLWTAGENGLILRGAVTAF